MIGVLLMTKELIQQLKETDSDTYKQYRLEYMKSLFDLKKFQFLFLKNNQSRTWTEDYMKNLLSKRNDLLFDRLKSIMPRFRQSTMMNSLKTTIIRWTNFSLKKKQTGTILKNYQ